MSSPHLFRHAKCERGGSVLGSDSGVPERLCAGRYSVAWMPVERGELSVLFEACLGFSLGGIEIPDSRKLISIMAGSQKNPQPKVPIVEEAMARAVESAPSPVLHAWFWPDAKPFAVALSHDVDEVRWSWRRRLLMAAKHPHTVLQENERYWNFDRVLALERRSGVRSSWYFVADGRHPRDPPYRLTDVASVMGELEKQGQEIGLHASYLSYADAAMLKREREAIGKALGRPVLGVRQHFLNFDSSVTWRIQREAGFEYDSTLAYNEVSGFRAGICHPYRPPGHNIMEIPLILMDGQLFLYERFSVPQAVANCERLSEAVAARGGLLTMNWHQHTYDSYSFPGFWDVYEHMLGWLMARDPAFLTGEEVWQWWNLRSSVHIVEQERKRGSATWTVSAPDRVPGLALRFLGPKEAGLHADAETRVTTRGDDHFIVFRELPADEPVTVASEW